MKFSALISVLFICFVFAACASDEEEATCVTAFDCPDGYSCVDSVCQPQSAESDSDSDDVSDTSDTSEPPSTGDSDDVLPGEDSDVPEIPDDIQGCPNACSGFGECDFEKGKCVCNETHGGEDCSECAEGYHLEAEGDDEDGNPDVRSCVVNMTCEPNPCNNNGCKEEGDTVKCTCTAASHAAGRWCEECVEGYAKSNVDGTCKEDCSKKNCTAPQKCGMDYTTNEASCNQCENEFYSGADCKSCDAAHFCNGHGTACVVEGGTEKCTCETAYQGAQCNTCAPGYALKNGECVKACTAEQCFTDFSCVLSDNTYNVKGHCNISTCECEQGWSTKGSGETVNCTDSTGFLVLDSRSNVMCTVCNIDNPPLEYNTTGCPTDCPSGFCDDNNLSSLGFINGQCYTEPVTHKVACDCSVMGMGMFGTMGGTGSKYYDDNPTGQCGGDSN
jgi:Laminin EGF-like (Domains III and V).